MTPTEQLVFFEELDLPDLLIENPFSGAFQFVFPQINIFTKDFQDKVKKLQILSSSFLENYLRVTRFFDEKLFARVKKYRSSLRYVHDFSFNNFGAQPMPRSLSASSIKKVDEDYRGTFSTRSRKSLVKHWKCLSFEVADTARTLSRQLAEPLLQVEYGHVIDDILQDSLGFSQEEIGRMAQARKILGYYALNYGQKREVDAEDFNELALASHDYLLRLLLDFAWNLKMCMKGTKDLWIEDGWVSFFPKLKGKTREAIAAAAKKLPAKDMSLLRYLTLADAPLEKRSSNERIEELHRSGFVEKKGACWSLTDLGRAVACITRIRLDLGP